MVDFRFNAYGGRFNPHDRDNAIPAGLASTWKMRRYESDMVLEGGGWTVDGLGTLITTEQCLLNPNRNPDMSREQIEAELLRCLGVTKVIWLPHGLSEDRDTDGHSDNVVQFVKPGQVVAQVAPDPENPNRARLEENLAVLRSATDAGGKTIDVVEMAPLPYTDEIDGHRYAVPYTNFYPVNGAVIVPQLNAPREDEAYALLDGLFPDREIVGVPSDMLAYGGGGVGCITLQVPAGEPLD
jgi:agmatine deiminase